MSEALQNPNIIRLVITAALIIAVFIARRVVAHWILGETHIVQEHQRRQLVWLRTAITVAFIVALLMVWGGHLQNLVLSLTALMVAIVLATKELLMCLTGFLLRTTGRLFSVGDWIECHGLRGEVTDQTLLSTTLLEVENPEYGYGFTGRTLILPNSVFLTNPVQTSPFARSYVPHRFVTSVSDHNMDPVVALEWLRGEANRACAPYKDDTARVSDNLDRKLGVDVEGPEPFITLGTNDTGELHFRVLIFCPRDRAAELEREIAANFLRAVRQGTFALQRDSNSAE